MRLAAYKVENLFDRARGMNLGSWEEGRPVLDRFARLSELLGQVVYAGASQVEMAEMMIELGLERSDPGLFVLPRRNRSKLLQRRREGGIEIVASGRIDWVGSLELRDEPINEQAMRNTAQVMRDLKADVLGVVEAVLLHAIQVLLDGRVPRDQTEELEKAYLPRAGRGGGTGWGRGSAFVRRVNMTGLRVNFAKDDTALRK